MRDDVPRLLAPPRLSDGGPNPVTSRGRLSLPARGSPGSTPHGATAWTLAASTVVSGRNGRPAAAGARHGDRRDRPDELTGGERAGVGGRSRWSPRRSPRRRAVCSWTGMRRAGGGGGYAGPLVYRDGEGMRPDVGAAYDRMAAAARRRDRSGGRLRLPLRCRAGRALRRHPDPTLGGAAGALAAPLRDRARPRPSKPPTAGSPRTPAASASSGGIPGSPGTSATAPARRPARQAGNAVGAAGGEAARSPRRRCPNFVPAAVQRRRCCARPRAGTSPPALLAAQLMAESGFDPARSRRPGARASPSSCRRRPPPTACAIRSTRSPRSTPQAHLMSDLLRQFGSPAGPRRLQRRLGRGRSLRLHPPLSGDPGLRQPASSPWRRRLGAALAAARGEVGSVVKGSRGSAWRHRPRPPPSDR